MKRIKSILLFCLCILIVSSSIVSCKKDDSETDVFLPQPDRIEGMYAGKKLAFSQEQKEQVYTAFVNMMPSLKKCERAEERELIPMEYEKNDFSLNFQYDSEHTYVGELSGVFNPIGNQAFDSVLLVVGENDLRLAPCKGGEMFQDAYGQVLLAFGEKYSEFKYEVIKNIIACMPDPFDIERDSLNTEVLSTSNFLDRPDSMVLGNGERAIKLSDVQKEQIYTAFSQMNASREGYPKFYGVSKQRFTVAEVYEMLETKSCLEFRYDQRRQFSGILAQTELEEGQVNYQEESFAFDAICLVLDENGMRIIIYKDGLYQSVTDYSTNFDFGPGYAAFRAEVLSLIA